MKTITYTKKIFGLFHVKHEIEKPLIQRAKGVIRFRPQRGSSQLRENTWKCVGAGYTGYGVTPWAAWTAWANWALV